MERQDQLPRCQATTDLGRRGERREIDRHRVAAGGDRRHKLTAAGGKREIGFPIRFGDRRVAGLIAPGPRRECCCERAAELTHAVDQGGEFRFGAQEGRPPRGRCRSKRPRIAGEQPLHRNPPAAKRLRRHPAMPRGRLRCLDGCIGATTSGRRNPRVKRVGPWRRQRGQGGKRVGGKVARGRISQERRKEGVGLPVGKHRRAGGDQLDEPCRLKEPRRARAGDLQGRLQPTVAIGHIAGRIVGKRPGIRRLAPERSPAGVTAQQPAVDLLERRRRSPRVAGGREQLGLGREQPRPQRRQVAPRPRTAPLDRGRHAPTAGHRIGGGRECKRLLEGAGIAEVGGGVGGFLEELRSPLRLIGLEGHPPEDDQAPARQPVVEAVAREEPAGEQGRGLIVLALRPGGGTERDVDP